jgi:hypothetical protein
MPAVLAIARAVVWGNSAIAPTVQSSNFGLSPEPEDVERQKHSIPHEDKLKFEL